MERITGYLIISFTTLTISLIIMLAHVAAKMDEFDGNYGRDLLGHIPPIIFLFLLIPIAVGAYLIDLGNKKDKNVKNKSE